MTTRRFQNVGRVAAVSGRARRRGGFSLIELLVVIAIIVVLISILLPSLHKSVRQATTAVCMHNLKQIAQGLELYKVDNDGWVPFNTGSNDKDKGGSSSSWFQKLFHPSYGYLGEPAVLICPDDPSRVWWLQNQPYSTDLPIFSSYGMNAYILNSPDHSLSKLDRWRPQRPFDTLLLADLGPDMFGSGGPLPLDSPNRRTGTLPFDDGFDPGEPSEQMPWLTARHLDGMNVLTTEGEVRWVPTRALMSQPIISRYDACIAGGCTLCLKGVYHYSFAISSQVSQTFWWTGPVPTP